MLGYVLAAVLLGVVPASQPDSAESEQSLVVTSAKRPTERAEPAPRERPVCSGRFVQPDPAIDAGMLRTADADVDPASVRRPDCAVQLDTPADRGPRDSRGEHGTWPSVQVPQHHAPEPPSEPSSESPAP